jgi:hypothetical protein
MAFQPQPLVLSTHQTSTHPLRPPSIFLGRQITHVDVKCNIVSAHVRALTWPRFVQCADINTQIHQRATDNSFRSCGQQLHNGKWTVLCCPLLTDHTQPLGMSQNSRLVVQVIEGEVYAVDEASTETVILRLPNTSRATLPTIFDYRCVYTVAVLECSHTGTAATVARIIYNSCSPPVEALSHSLVLL